MEKEEENREELFRKINEMCRNFWEERMEKPFEPEYGQFKAEGYFGSLWKGLERLFKSQHWDYGEFRKKEKFEEVI